MRLLADLHRHAAPSHTLAPRGYEGKWSPGQQFRLSDLDAIAFLKNPERDLPRESARRAMG